MPTFEYPKVDWSKADWSKFELPKVEWTKVELPDLPDLSKLDLSKFDLSKFDLSKFDLSKFDPRNIDLPFELPELPQVDLPSADEVLGFARDAAYVGVGLAVLTAERLQKLQDELLEVLKTQLEKVRAAV